MSNLAAGSPPQPYGKEGRKIDLGVKAAAQIWQGAMVSQISGACCPGTTANAGPCIGIAAFDVLGDASTDGVQRLTVYTDQIFTITAGTAAPSDSTPIGTLLYMETDNTVGTGGSAGGATFQVAGRFAGFTDDGRVKVYFSATQKAEQDGENARTIGTVLTDTSTQTVQRAGRFTVSSLATLSQNGALTLGTTGAVYGDVYRIVRTDVSAHTYAVVNGGAGAGTLATLVASKNGWLQAWFDGTNWTFDGCSAT